MWRFTKDVLLTILMGLSLWGVYACSGCAPATLAPAGASRPAVTGASVVTLVRPEARWTWGALSSDVADNGTGFRLRYEPSCNAFAIEPETLVTAAHCVRGIEPGGEVRYLSPDGVGYGFAELVRVDLARDLAWARAGGLKPLPVASPPAPGSVVISVSSFYEAVNTGSLVAQLSTSYYETTQTIIKGWSGSPVFDARGRVWAVVSRCHVASDSDDCIPGATIVTALE